MEGDTSDFSEDFEIVNIKSDILLKTINRPHIHDLNAFVMFFICQNFNIPGTT